jgi:phage shock protein E
MNSLLSILLFAISLSAYSQSATKIQNLKTAEFIAKLNATANKQLLDVRTPTECGQGKVGSASCLDYNAPDFADKINKLDKNKPVFVYCAAGGRSAKAAKILEEKGFKQIYNLTAGGYADLAKAGVK